MNLNSVTNIHWNMFTSSVPYDLQITSKVNLPSCTVIH